MLVYVQEQGWPMPISKSILSAGTATLSSNFNIFNFPATPSMLPQNGIATTWIIPSKQTNPDEGRLRGGECEPLPRSCSPLLLPKHWQCQLMGNYIPYHFHLFALSDLHFFSRRDVSLPLTLPDADTGSLQKHALHSGWICVLAE